MLSELKRNFYYISTLMVNCDEKNSYSDRIAYF